MTSRKDGTNPLARLSAICFALPQVTASAVEQLVTDVAGQGDAFRQFSYRMIAPTRLAAMV